MTRDTDQDWRIIGAEDPYFGVRTDPKFHIGRIDAAALDEFYASGVADIDFVLGEIRARLGRFAPARALDFGCGVGRLALAMAAQAGQVTGLDVSADMLALGHAAAEARGVGNAGFVDHLADGTFDWINAFTVFQHIPPERGYTLLDDLLGRLALGGVLSLQVTLFRDRAATGRTDTATLVRYDGRDLVGLVPDDRLGPGVISMFDYDLNRILALLALRGVEPFALTPTDHGGHHGVWLFAQMRARRRLLAPGTALCAPAFAPLLETGWAAMEDWGVWTDATTATLMLRTDGRAGATLSLAGQAFLHPGAQERLEVRAAVAGGGSADLMLTLAQPSGLLALAWPASAELLRVTLTLATPRSPRACGAGADGRLLGFGLQRIALSP